LLVFLLAEWVSRKWPTSLLLKSRRHGHECRCRASVDFRIHRPSVHAFRRREISHAITNWSKGVQDGLTYQTLLA